MKVMLQTRRLAALTAALLLASCGGTSAGPEPIPLDDVNCARCGMLVSSDAHAGQSRTPGEATRFFDDIGCLALDAASHANGTVRYVHASSGKWVSADAAWFALADGVRTPMDHGIVAFDSRAAAEQADRERHARPWAEVIAYVGQP
jgi:hypothetical protein